MNTSQWPPIIHEAALAWAQETYQTTQIEVIIEQEEDDDPERYIALIAVAGQTDWLAAEVWVETGKVVAINELGEGIPPDGTTWPWSADND